MIKYDRGVTFQMIDDMNMLDETSSVVMNIDQGRVVSSSSHH